MITTDLICASYKQKARGFKIVELDKQQPSKGVGVPQLPKRGTAQSAAYDFFSPIDTVIEPGGGSVTIYTNVKAYMEPDEVLLLNVRSSHGKDKIRMANTQGWIDADFYGNSDNDGNIQVTLENHGEHHYFIARGDKIMQGLFTKYLRTDDDDAQGVRVGGLGSTGR